MSVLLTSEHIVGGIAIVGATLVILNRFGLLHFGKREDKIKDMQRCPAHEETVKFMAKLGDKINTIHDNQIKNITLHNTTQKRIDLGDEEIRTLKKDIKQLCIGVALLLERTGGKPKSFTDGEVIG